MSGRSAWRDYVEALVVALVLATFTRTFLFQAFEIPTGSMEKNLLVGDHILVNKFVYGAAPTAIERALLPVREVRRGDVVVFRYPRDPSQDFIKRCVAVGGDRVEIARRALIIDGRHVDDHAYTYHFGGDPAFDPAVSFEANPRDDFGPLTVPDESYFCLGDNRDNSHDSRFWGPVPRGHLKGRALLIYWSIDQSGEILARSSPGGAWRRWAARLERLPAEVRWERTLHLVR